LFSYKTVFSDEATFHFSGKVNHHNLIIWRSHNPRQVVEHVRDSPKVDIFCAVSRTQVTRPFFFTQTSFTDHAYLDMLEHFLISQLKVNNVIWQHGGVTSHYQTDVTRYLKQIFLVMWRLQSVATHITRELFTYGICEK
jgi:hypothetical protein